MAESAPQYPQYPYNNGGYPAPTYAPATAVYPPPPPPSPYHIVPNPGGWAHTGELIGQLGGSCIDCFSGPPGVPDHHPLGGCRLDEFLQGCCIPFGYGLVELELGESVDGSPCNLGCCYYMPYVGSITGFLVHYPLRKRFEALLTSGSTYGAVATCPIIDAACVFCFPSCHMCQALRAIRGARYRAQLSGGQADCESASLIVAEPK